MSTNNKNGVVKSYSFVGLTSRSKNGCLSCRKKKKKCDECHPVCGLCKKKNIDCVWRSKEKKEHKYKFDVKSVMESQKLILLEKNFNVDNSTSKDSKKITSKLNDIKFSNAGSDLKSKSINGSNRSPSQFSAPNPKNSYKNLVFVDAINNNKKLPNRQSPLLQPIFKESDNQDFPQIPETYQNQELNPSWFNDVVKDESQMNSLLNNIVQHISSPHFDPDINYMDNVINSALLLHSKDTAFHDDTFEFSSKSSPEIFSPSTILLRQFNEDQIDKITDITEKQDSSSTMTNNTSTILRNYNPINLSSSISIVCDEEDYQDTQDIEDYQDYQNEKFLPMDESQLLENNNLTETELITLFKSKRMQPYLRPAIHALFSRNDSLHIINPSSPYISTLDSTGKLFLEHYISFVAIEMLDFGNKQFYVDYALRLAAMDESILYCLVAWGGMFLVGRNNKIALDYFNKGMALTQKKRKLSKLTNQDYLILLSFNLFSLGAEITTGDVQNWFQMLIHCKDLLNDYGGIKKFVKNNQNNKEAKWILSNIFYHDILGSRTLDFGTLIEIKDYKEIFVDEKFLCSVEYGLDPFQGLSNGLYLLLGEVVNKRKELKYIKYELELAGGHLDKKEYLIKKYGDILKTWFKTFDEEILNSKPHEISTNYLMKDNVEDKLLELHLTWFELNQLSLQIYIRISFKELEFTNPEIQHFKKKCDKLFSILIGTKLQTLLCLPMLMIGITCITSEQKSWMTTNYERYLTKYEIKNIPICWEVIQQVWKECDQRVQNGNPWYCDWSDIVASLGWNCCFT